MTRHSSVAAAQPMSRMCERSAAQQALSESGQRRVPVVGLLAREQAEGEVPRHDHGHAQHRQARHDRRHRGGRGASGTSSYRTTDATAAAEYSAQAA